jgi:hypothetical protein
MDRKPVGFPKYLLNFSMLEAPVFRKYFDEYSAQEMPFLERSGGWVTTETYLFDERLYMY